MKTIEERAKDYTDMAVNVGDAQMFCRFEGYIIGATEQRAIDFAMFQSFLSERGLLFGKYTKANGDTGYKTLDDLWEYFNNKE